VYSEISSGRYYAKPRLPLALGIIVTLRRGLEFSKNHPATA
jgi:hypothetical protein